MKRKSLSHSVKHTLKAILAASGLLAASPVLASNPATESVHVVKAGETLGGIANRANVSANAIAKANGLSEPYTVREGQRLKIPRNGATQSNRTASNAARPQTAQTSNTVNRNPTTAMSYTVGAGETLSGVAARTKVPRILIAEANGLHPPYNVHEGQVLRLPRTRHHTVKAGDTARSISSNYDVPWQQIALASNLDPSAPVKAGQKLFIPTILTPPTSSSAPIPAPAPSASATQASGGTRSARFAWPLSGSVRRGYVASGRNYHDGIDIPAAAGTAVRAAAAGTVRFAGAEKDQFGNLVVLDHGNGWFTAYGFLSRVTVQQGAPVSAGERVGLVGNTGLAKGYELHFEVRQDGKPVNPLNHLPRTP